MASNNRICFKEFREKNNLKQVDIAKLLEVSPAFISQIEKGDSSLSQGKLEKLLDISVIEDWDVSSLLPEYTRVTLVLDYFEARGIKRPLSDATIYNMRTGVETLTDLTVLSLCAKCPELNQEWLLTGEGDMILPHEPVTNDELKLLISNLEQELSYARSEISELKSMLAGLIELKK